MMRATLMGLTMVVIFGAAGVAADKPPRAEEILEGARATASEQHKNVFVSFGASWCEPCHELESFLASPQIQPIITKHFVITRVTVAEEYGGNPKLNNPGGEKLFRKLGGAWGSLPFFAIVDSNGQLIANSRKPPKSKDDSGNIGFPTEPDEIEWFVNMLKKGAPGLGTEDARIVQEILQSGE
ncbi:MAG: thioredoxin family protein [Terriglobia bacterium]